MRFTSEAAANLRTKNDSTLRGAVEALIQKGRGRLEACRVRRLDDISAFIELPDGIAAIAMVEAAHAEGLFPIVFIPLSPDDASAAQDSPGEPQSQNPCSRG
jgi:hypothetical protein